MKSLLSLFILLLIVTSAFSQDHIIKISGDTINCKVTEMGAVQIKYYYGSNEKLVFGIDNALVDRVEFATGEVVKTGKNSLQNPEYYARQHKNALKINFLSPLMGSTAFTFERSIKPGRSWETTLGIVGLGFDSYEYDPSGFFAKFAYKFTRTPDFYMNRMHYSHILKGAYIAPEIAVRYVSYDDNWYYDSYSDSDSDREQFTIAVMLKFGKQWVIDDSFLIDLFCGVGYGFNSDDYDALPYGFIVGTDEFPIAFTSGLRIGWVFGK